MEGDLTREQETKEGDQGIKGPKERTNSGQERSSTYRSKNPQMAKLSQQRQAIKIREKRTNNPEFDEHKRKADAERKRDYRKRRNCQKQMKTKKM